MWGSMRRSAHMFGRLELLYDDYGTKSYDMGKGMTCDGAITAVTLRAALVYQFGQPN